MAVSALAKELNIEFKKAECKSLTATTYIKGEPTILAKPQTYMNLSGEAVKELTAKYKIDIKSVIVFCDDIDLPIGAVRIRKSGSAGTHNGLKNIIAETQKTEFIRIRVGVGSKPNKEMDLADYVLGKFSKQELEIITPAISDAAKAALDLINGVAFDTVMQRYNHTVA